jgi:hypothetical protein
MIDAADEFLSAAFSDVSDDNEIFDNKLPLLLLTLHQRSSGCPGCDRQASQSNPPPLGHASHKNS